MGLTNLLPAGCSTGAAVHQAVEGDGVCQQAPEGKGPAVTIIPNHRMMKWIFMFKLKSRAKVPDAFRVSPIF